MNIFLRFILLFFTITLPSHAEQRMTGFKDEVIWKDAERICLTSTEFGMPAGTGRLPTLDELLKFQKTMVNRGIYSNLSFWSSSTESKGMHLIVDLSTESYIDYKGYDDRVRVDYDFYKHRFFCVY